LHADESTPRKMRFYPDTNVAHRLRTSCSPASFDALARSRGTTLALGFHVVYELARAFLSGHNVDDVKATCDFLADVNQIEYQPALLRLIESELHLAETRIPLLTALAPLNQVSTRLELRRLARGDAARATQFISQRETRVETLRQEIAFENRSLLQGQLPEDRESKARRQTFDGFREQVNKLGLGVDVLKQLTAQHGFSVRDSTYRTILRSRGEYPVLTTYLNCQWHMLFVAVIQGVDPADDAQDDLRHLIESARCDLFVTADRKLLGRVSLLSPSRPGQSWEDFSEGFGAV